MLRIVLAHPGATDFDDQGRIKGNLDIPLSPSGIHQVDQSAVELQDSGISVVYCGPGMANEGTASMIAKEAGARVKKIDAFVNLDHGLWHGKLVDEVKVNQPKVYRQWQENPEAVCPPGGETLESARQRITPVLARILRKHRQGVIAIVAPEPLMSLVRTFVSEGELGDLWAASSEHGGYEVVEAKAKAGV